MAPPAAGLTALFMVGACSDSKPVAAEQSHGVDLVSPSQGAIVRAPWIPLMLHLDQDLRKATVRVRLDGEPYVDPLAFTRPRLEDHGGGHDYLAWLDLRALEPGAHQLSFEVFGPDDRIERASTHFEYQRNPHRVKIEIVDGEGRPTSGRVLVEGMRGPINLAGPDAAAADPGARDIELSSVFAIDGKTSLWLLPGWYRLTAVRDLRDEVDVQEVTLAGDTTVRFTVRRSVETPGRLSADLHVHTGRSSDSYLPDQARYRSLLAAGLDVAVVTDHKRVTEPERPLLEIARESQWATRGIAGFEARLGIVDPSREDGERGMGHMNVFPVGPGASRLDTSAPDVATHIERFRDLGGPRAEGGEQSRTIVQLNHPRGIQFHSSEEPRVKAHALFNLAGYQSELPLTDEQNRWLVEPTPGGTTALDFDALEVVNRFSWPLYLQVRSDWFALLNQGHRLTATGNSDSHALTIEQAGMTLNLVGCPPPGKGEPLDVACFVDALAAGHNLVSTGPVVELSVERPDGAAAQPGDAIGGGPLVARVRVRAASWVPVAEARLVRDGVVVQRAVVEQVPGQPLDQSWSWPIDGSADGWVAAEAGWPLEGQAPASPDLGTYGKVAPGYVPLGFTNPVYLDVDGIEGWTAPGL